MHAILTFMAYMHAFMASTVILHGIKSAKKKFHGKMTRDIVFQRKKTELK
jgi:hypothetical protein